MGKDACLWVEAVKQCVLAENGGKEMVLEGPGEKGT